MLIYLLLLDQAKSNRFIYDKKYKNPSKNADIHILLIFRLLPNILFLKKYYPCRKFEIYGV